MKKIAFVFCDVGRVVRCPHRIFKTIPVQIMVTSLNSWEPSCLPPTNTALQAVLPVQNTGSNVQIMISNVNWMKTI